MRHQALLSDLVLATVVRTEPHKGFGFARVDGSAICIVFYANKRALIFANEDNTPVLTFSEENEHAVAMVNSKILLARRSKDPRDQKEYHRAYFWCEEKRMKSFQEETRIKISLFRVIGYNHLINGKVHSNTNKEEIVISGTLAEIERVYPKKIGQNDPVGTGRPYVTDGIGGVTLSRENWWQIWDGTKWIDDEDRRTLDYTKPHVSHQESWAEKLIPSGSSQLQVA